MLYYPLSLKEGHKRNTPFQLLTMLSVFLTLCSFMLISGLAYSSILKM
jgi:hypothetical protein